MSKRIYKVLDGTSQYMVRANSKAVAINCVVRMAITAEVASQDDLIEHVKSGAKIHDAGEKIGDPQTK